MEAAHLNQSCSIFAGPASKAEGDAIWELALAMDATLMLQQVDAHRSALATAMAALAEQGSDVLEFITQALDALTQMEGASDKGLTDLKNEQRPTLEELKSFVALAVDLAKLVDGFFGNSLAASGGVPKQLLDEIASFAKVELISGKYVASTPTSGDMCWPSEPAHAMARTLLGADESTMITAKEEQTDSLIIVVEQCKSSVTSLKNGLERLAAVFIEEPKLEEEEEDLGDLQYPGGAFDPLGLPGPSDGGDGRKSLIDSVINWLSDIKTFFTGAARPKVCPNQGMIFILSDVAEGYTAHELDQALLAELILQQQLSISHLVRGGCLIAVWKALIRVPCTSLWAMTPIANST